MVIILIYWLYVLIFSALAGHLVLSRFIRTNEALPFIYYPFTGFAAIAVINSWISLLTGISGVVHLIELGGIILYAAFNFRQIKSDLSCKILENNEIKIGFYLLFFLVIVTGLAYTAITSRTYDEGLYYLQNIRWISEYGVVKGLGNLHGRLAFNSSWHVLAAFFQLPGLIKGGFDDINGLMYVLIGGYSVFSAFRLRKHFSLGELLKASMILPSVLLYQGIMSAAADLAVVYYFWLTIIVFIEMGEGKENSWRAKMIFLFTAFLLSVKVSSLIILIIPAWIMYNYWQSYRIQPLRYALIIFFIIITPWLLRNICLSGYLVYPIQVTGFLHPDWQVPESKTYMEALAIKSYARIPHVDYETVARMPLKMWLPRWWHLRKPDEKILIIFSFLSILAIPILLLRRKQKANAFVINSAITLISAILFWFFTAPDPRFAYAQLWFCCVLAVYLTFSIKKLYLSWMYLFQTGAVILQLVALFILVKPKEVISHFITPSPPPVVQTKSIQLNGRQIFIPANGNQCWDAELPCTPQIDSLLEWRGKEISEGFRMRK